MSWKGLADARVLSGITVDYVMCCSRVFCFVACYVCGEYPTCCTCALTPLLHIIWSTLFCYYSEHCLFIIVVLIVSPQPHHFFSCSLKYFYTLCQYTRYIGFKYVPGIYIFPRSLRFFVLKLSTLLILGTWEFSHYFGGVWENGRSLARS